MSSRSIYDNQREDQKEEDFTFEPTIEQRNRRGRESIASSGNRHIRKKRSDEKKLKKKKKKEDGEKKKRRTPSKQVQMNSSIASRSRVRIDSDCSGRSSTGDNMMYRTKDNEKHNAHDDIPVVRSGMQHEKMRKKRRRKQNDSNNTSIVKGPYSSPSSNILRDLPSNLNDPKQLKWHKRFIPGLQEPMYYPCRIIPEESSKSTSKKFTSQKKAYNLDVSSSSSDSSCNSNKSSDDDNNDEVQIEYISKLNSYREKKKSTTTSSTQHYRTIRKSRLIPYHGELSDEEEDSLDYNDIVSSKWCKKLYKLYKQQRNSPQGRKSRVQLQQHSFNHDNELLVDLSCLNDILNIAKQRAGYITTKGSSGRSRSSSNGANEDVLTPYNRRKKGKQLNNDNDDDESIEPYDNLVEPYTQEVDFKALGYNSSDVEVEEFYRDLKKNPSELDTATNNKNMNNNKKREPILPGDVIEYYHPIFVFGDERGRRTTTVISVNPKNKHSMLKLSNEESLPKDVKVRRIKTLIEDDSKSINVSGGGGGNDNNALNTSNVQRRLIDHPGIFREIQEFKLVKLNAIKGYHITTEKDRVKGILRKNVEKFQKKVKTSGFAPLDLMNNFGMEKGRGHCNSSIGDESDNILLKSKLPEHNTKHSKHSSCSSSDSDSDLKSFYEVHRQVKTNSHIPQPATASFKRKVAETNSPYNREENSSDDDEMMKKLNRYKTLSKVGHDFHSKVHIDKRIESNTNKNNTNKSLLPLLSLRDTDEEDSDEHILYNDDKEMRQLGGNNISSSLGGKGKRVTFLKSLGLSDSEDDELEPAIFSRRIKQVNQIRNDEHLKHQMSSLTTKIEKPFKNGSHNDEEVSFDFHSSNSDESILSALTTQRSPTTHFKSLGKNMSETGCSGDRHSNSKVSVRSDSPIIRTTKCHPNLKSSNKIRLKDSPSKFRPMSESKHKINQSSEKVSMTGKEKLNQPQKSPPLKSLTFKCFKYN